MVCKTCDVDLKIEEGSILLDDRHGIQIWKFPNGAAHVFHARQQAERVAEEVAEVQQQD
jgi:hypothetical protein